MPWLSVYMPKSHEQIIKRFRKLAKREGKAHSRILLELMIHYLNEHEHGNPQKPLLPGDVIPPAAYSKHPVVRRKQVMDDLLATVQKNPGVDMLKLAAAFSHASGLRRQTVMEYLQTLLMAKKIRRSGGKLYG